MDGWRLERVQNCNLIFGKEKKMKRNMAVFIIHLEKNVPKVTPKA